MAHVYMPKFHKEFNGVFHFAFKRHYEDAGAWRERRPQALQQGVRHYSYILHIGIWYMFLC